MNRLVVVITGIVVILIVFVGFVLIPLQQQVITSNGSTTQSTSETTSTLAESTVPTSTEYSSTSLLSVYSTASSIETGSSLSTSASSTTSSSSTLQSTSSSSLTSTTYSSTTSPSSSTTSANTSNPIKHVIVIMQENRSFDNYFWTWPGQIGYNSTLCMPNDPTKPSAGCLKPTLFTDPALSGDLPHDWTSSWASYNSGRMNGFLKAANDNPAVMAYYNNSTIPNLWSYASNYVLGDNYFTSVKSYSQPNHWYMIAANSPVISLTTGSSQQEASCYNSTTKKVTLSTCTYINQAQQISTMADELTNYGITWKYYDTPAPSKTLDGAIASGAAFAYWDPLNARNTTYTNSTIHSNLVPRVDILWDIGNGTLPSVSWVIPSSPISDHPPANVVYGMWWITDIVNSVMNSKYWNDTAIVVLWDDYGGFYDTVVPPTIDNYGLSFRCPALIISAYARPGYLDHTVYSFESTLRFMEWIWHLPFLSFRDAFANNLIGAFNFDQKPLRTDLIPLTKSELSTISPYILEGGNPSPNPGGTTSTSSSLALDNDGLQFINNDPD